MVASMFTKNNNNEFKVALERAMSVHRLLLASRMKKGVHDLDRHNKQGSATLDRKVVIFREPAATKSPPGACVSGSINNQIQFHPPLIL